MLAQGTFGVAFRGFLAFHGLALYAVAPSARNAYGLLICTVGVLLPLLCQPHCAGECPQ